MSTCKVYRNIQRYTEMYSTLQFSGNPVILSGFSGAEAYGPS